jgi:hypothetical protein
MLFMLYSLVSDVKIDMPSYNISPTAILAEHAASCLHEVNELYDGTLNSICAYTFSTIALDMLNNKVLHTQKQCSNLTLPNLSRPCLKR